MRKIILFTFSLLILTSCNEQIAKDDSSLPWSISMKKLKESESLLTKINPMNKGVVIKTANQIEKYATDLYLNHKKEMDTISLEFVLECLAKSAEIQSNYNDAIDFFIDAQKLNPSSEKAPAYLHNVARIFDHVLEDKNMARLSYQKLIKLYPEHPLSKNAKLYLDNVFDKSEEDLLNMIKENNS